MSETPQSELSKLLLRDDENVTSEIKTLLRGVIENGIDEDIVEPITSLLRSDDIEIRRLSAHSVAELCKCDEKRTKYALADVIRPLVDNLNRPVARETSDLHQQSLRALGNVCYESYAGRDLVLNEGGVPKVVSLLAIDNGDVGVRSYACKLLCTLVLGGSDYIKPALDAGVVERLHGVIEREVAGDDGRLYDALLVLSLVAEYARSLVMDERLTLLVVDVLKAVKSMEISEACLEYLHYQVEHDDIKTVLAKAAVPQVLWNLLEKHRALAVDEETRDLMKLACDLIALILTGDNAMNFLYDNGKGEFYQSMVKSVNSEDEELSITALLAIGNFARTDSHCMDMMDSGVFAKLMSLLSSHKNQEDNIRLQHAILSGLRHLVIPQRNKLLAVEQGILPLLIEMVPNISHYHVVFKLLATLRMLVDGQELVAEQLVGSGILHHVATWGLQSEHSGVSGEASRLIARVIRQLQRQESFSTLVEAEGCVNCLVNMLAATHSIMQNEAIVALTILCVTCFSNENDSKTALVAELIKTEFLKQLTVLLQMNVNKMQSEVAENLYKFLSLLKNQPPLKEQMCNVEFVDLLKQLTVDNVKLNDSLKELLDRLICDFSVVNNHLAE